jgi:SAM-dependent methyltransferase
VTRASHPVASEEAIWQDVEFGAYAGDLPLWEELADVAEGPVLELGAGSGRVALHLASRGAEVIAVDRDPRLVAELAERARRGGLPVTALEAELSAPAGSWRLPSSAPGLVIAPLHVTQQLEPSSRGTLLGSLAELIAPRGRAALAVVDEDSLVDGPEDSEGERSSEVPDMRDVGGWVYSSEPLWVQRAEHTLTVRRLRSRVSPDGELERSVHDDVLNRLAPDELEREAARAGLSATGRRTISSGAAEADSLAVILEAP